MLEALALYEVLTIRDLASLLYERDDKVSLASIVRTTRILEQRGFVNRIFFRPEDYAGMGTLPLACGLSEQGVAWAYEHCPWTDPKLFRRDHSPHTMEHELKRARFHVLMLRMCSQNNIQLFWKKTDLNHTVKPDDVFAVKQGDDITYYFFELENKRKSFNELLEKYQRYEDYYGTMRCKEEWFDFRTFTVVTQMRSDESRLNIVKFLAGEPAIFNGQRVVIPTPIRRDTFWFSTEANPFTFITPADYQNTAYTFLALAGAFPA